MKAKKANGLFSSTNSLKILSFLAGNPTNEFLGREIQKATSISRAGVYIALSDLIKQGLVYKKQKGRFLLYSLDYENIVVRQFKVLNNAVFLQPIVSKLKPLSKKIILYGSTSRGEDNRDSDIDLFVVSQEPQAVKEILVSRKNKRKIQVVIKTPSEFTEFKDKEKIFWREVDRGIILWEEKE